MVGGSGCNCWYSTRKYNYFAEGEEDAAVVIAGHEKVKVKVSIHFCLDQWTDSQATAPQSIEYFG